MLIRRFAFLAPAFASVFGVSQAEAGCFGKRNCCQATPIVCPPCAPVYSTVQVYQPANTIVPLSSGGCCGAVVEYSTNNVQAPAATTEATVMQKFEETFKVLVPFTEQIERDGKVETVTRTREETRTRVVERSVPASQVIEELRLEIARLGSQNSAQDGRLADNDKLDNKQTTEIEGIKKKVP